MKIKNPLTIVGSSENLNEVLDQQEQLINELTEALEDRDAPGSSDKPIWDGNDLKGTTWLFNKRMTSELLPGTFKIVGVANDGVRYTAGNYIYSTMDIYNNVYIFGDKEHNTFPSFMYSIGNNSMVYQYQEYVYDEMLEEDVAVNKFIETNNVYVTIYDGADTTLSFVVNWFKENATLISHSMPED